MSDALSILLVEDDEDDYLITRQVPMVLLTGVGQRDIDVAATEAGAADYLDKSELSTTILDRTIRYAIANAASMKALAEKTGFLEATLENTGAGIAAFDVNGSLIMSNHLFSKFLKISSGRSFAPVMMRKQPAALSRHSYRT